MFLSSPVNTKNFFFLFYRTNKQRYLQQKHGSTGLVCLCPLKDVNLDKRFTVLVTTWEKVNGLSEHESLNEKVYQNVSVFLCWHDRDKVRFCQSMLCNVYNICVLIQNVKKQQH